MDIGYSLMDIALQMLTIHMQESYDFQAQLSSILLCWQLDSTWALVHSLVHSQVEENIRDSPKKHQKLAKNELKVFHYSKTATVTN